MRKVRTNSKSPDPSKVRTNTDWVMIALGLFLVLLFLIGGYVSLNQTPKAPPTLRGPVKDPKQSLAPTPGAIENKNPFRRAYGSNHAVTCRGFIANSLL